MKEQENQKTKDHNNNKREMKEQFKSGKTYCGNKGIKKQPGKRAPTISTRINKVVTRSL